MFLTLMTGLACSEPEPVPVETGDDCPQDTGYAPGDQPSQDLLAELPPVVVRSVPQAGDKAVDPGLSRITVTFSKDMNGGSWSWVTVPGWTFPEPAKAEFVNARTAAIEVDLEPDTTYAMGANSAQFQNFVDTDGNPAVPWVLAFHTAPE